MARSQSALAAANLVRAGFQDGDRAAEGLARLGDDAETLLPYLARTADPDLALDAFGRLVDAVGPGLSSEVAQDEGTAMRLLSVLGMSTTLGDHLVRHPHQWRELCDPLLGSTRPAAWALRAALLGSVGADPAAAEPVATLPQARALDALRVEYRRLLVRLVARDLAHDVPVEDVASELSDLASGTLEAALAVARAQVPDAGLARLAVIAMGKCGGRELNYVSDVDVVFVAEAAPGANEARALRVAGQLAGALMQACSETTAEGAIWPVDAALRPEGRAGSLVRTLASHVAYYERWAKTWEFQALLKARPVAGDADLGAAYLAAIRPLVWEASGREGFVEDVQAMRRRVVAHIPAHEAERQLKLGSGGLRDVEFAVQLMQLVHGRYDESVRDGSTLAALGHLTEGGYVGRRDGRALHEAYAFLRKLEHRIQLHHLRRTHVLPEDDASLRRLGRSLGHLRRPVEALDNEWRGHRRVVRRLHEKLFYRPLLGAVARIPEDGVRLTTEAAAQRLAALGYADPRAALRHLQALTGGVTRTATIQRTLLPVLLEWFADAPDPDAGLLGFRRISEALGRTPWYLRMMRDEGQAAQRLAQVLGTSRYVTDLLEREPEGVQILGDEGGLEVRGRDRIQTEMLANAARRDDPVRAIHAVRAIRRRELLRISATDLCLPFDVAEVGYALTDLTSATLEAALAVATRAVEAERRRPLETRMAVVAMGRYGGHELGYASDADVMFVHQPDPGADPQLATSMAQAVAHELRRLLALPGSDPALDVDADLRPEGRGGPLVRTLDSYAGYYARWSQVWEAQALLRAEALIGDPALRAEFHELVDPLRYPVAGLTEDDLREIRRIKARVDAERLPRGADPRTHFKLGRGGLADIEWTVQVLQLQHAARLPDLRTPRTVEALEACVENGVLDRDAADVLIDAWRLVSRTRNASVLVRGRPSVQVPTHPRELAAVSRQLGYGPGETAEMLNDYQRATRLAAECVERVFWS